MNSILTAFFIWLLAIAPAIAQVGPGPTPSPWIVNGAQVYYAQGCVTVSVTKPGACNGIGSFNTDKIYDSGILNVTGLSTLTGGFSAGAASTVTGTFGASGTTSLATGSINSLVIGGAASTFGPTVGPAGEANTYLLLFSKGTQSIFFNTGSTNGLGSSSVTQASIANTASAVNPLIFSGGATGNAATIRSSGETNAPLALSSMGTGRVQIYGGNFGAVIGQFIPVASATAGFTFTNSNGSDPTISVSANALNLSSANNFIKWSGTSPSLMGSDTSVGTDLKNWRITLSGGGMDIQTINDGLSAATRAYAIGRGTTYNVASHAWYTSTVAGTAVQRLGVVNGVTTVYGDNTVSFPQLIIKDTDNGADLKNWSISGDNGANFNLLANNDANSTSTPAYRVTRGTTYNVASHHFFTSTVAGTSVEGLEILNTGGANHITVQSATSPVLSTSTGSLTHSAASIFSSASQTAFTGAGIVVSGAGSAAAASMIMIDQASTTSTRLRNFGPTGAAAYSTWALGSNKSDGTAEVDWLTVDATQNIASSRPWAFSGATTFTSTATFSGTSGLLATKMVNAAEPSTISATAATGTINYDVCTQSILYYTTSAAANWTLNLRCSSGTSLNTAMATGDTVTVTFLVTQGASPFYNNVLTVDGGANTPKCQGGTCPSAGNASGIDAYTYAIIKTANATFTVLESQTQFK